MQVNSTGIVSLAASAALAPYLRVKYDSTNGLAAAGATDKELGTLRNRHLVTGVGAADHAPVVVPTAPGTVKMVAAGAISAFASVYGAASGKIAATANGNYIGVALEAATADGDYIEVLRLPATAEGAIKTVEAHTAADTLTVAESGSIHTNTGATGAVTLTLPAAVVGLDYLFSVGAAQELRIDPNGTETISLPSSGVQGAAGKYLTANAVGEWVRLICVVAATWTSHGYAGTWAAET